MYDKLQKLRSQKEAGENFNFTGAIYTVIPKDGTEPRFLQPGRSKSAAGDLAQILRQVQVNGDRVVAAWIGQYRTDMFLIDDMDTVIDALEKRAAGK